MEGMNLVIGLIIAAIIGVLIGNDAKARGMSCMSAAGWGYPFLEGYFPCLMEII